MFKPAIAPCKEPRIPLYASQSLGWNVQSYDMDCYVNEIDWTASHCDKLLVFEKEEKSVLAFIESKIGMWRNSVVLQLKGCKDIFQRYAPDWHPTLVFCFVGKGSRYIKQPLSYPRVNGREIIHINPDQDLCAKLRRIGIL